VENVFFQTTFFVIKCAPFFYKIEEDLNINDYERKTIGEIHLNAFVSNILLTLKILNFENVSLTKVIHFYVIQSMDA